MVGIDRTEAQEIVHALRLFADQTRKNIPAGVDAITVREATTYAESLDAHANNIAEEAKKVWPDFMPMPPPGFGA